MEAVEVFHGQFSVRKTCEALPLAPQALYRPQARSRKTTTCYQRKSSEVQRPKLLRAVPNQLLSCNIPKLRAEGNWTCSSLDVIMDVHSRYVVGGIVAHRESTEPAKTFTVEICLKHAFLPEQRTGLVSELSQTIESGL